MPDSAFLDECMHRLFVPQKSESSDSEEVEVSEDEASAAEDKVTAGEANKAEAAKPLSEDPMGSLIQDKTVEYFGNEVAHIQLQKLVRCLMVLSSYINSADEGHDRVRMLPPHKVP